MVSISDELPENLSYESNSVISTTGPEIIQEYVNKTTHNFQNHEQLVLFSKLNRMYLKL